MSDYQSNGYMAYKPSDYFVEIDERFIDNIRQGVKEPQAPLLMEVVEYIVEEALDAFFIQPSHYVGLSGGGRKAVDWGVSTAKKAIHASLKQVIKKLKNDDLRPLADYMDALLVKTDEGAHVGFPISEDLEQRLQGIFAKMREDEDPKAHVPALKDALFEVEEHAMKAYFAVPLSLLKLGPIMRKMVDAAEAGTRKGSQLIINRVFDHMDEKQLVENNDYLASLIIKGPPHPPDFHR